ncbi:MAG: PadR family transcriptional regulator [Actinomycetota bacterium]|nr:PadR family transcriptional regulator [Actinomycetota bacterium]
MKQPGMLELPVLGLLKERSMHGYELRKELGAMLGPFWQVSWGSLYPTLRRLARMNAVEKVVEQSRPRRATKSRAATSKTKPKSKTMASVTGGRRKTVYRITSKGDDMFKMLLEETSATIDTETFTIKLAFFRYLKPEIRVVLLERRRAYLQEKLAQLKANLRNYRDRMDTYAVSLQSHDMAATETDIAWIDELISKERTQAISRRQPTIV